jgi:molecular chaperone DnaK
LSREEIDRLVKDAELHTEEDRRKKALVDARNAADGLIYTTEKTLADQADKIDSTTRSEVERAVGDLKKAIEGDNVDNIKRLTENLTHASHALAQSMYQQTGPSAGQQAGPRNGYASQSSASGGDEEVLDAEYEEVA